MLTSNQLQRLGAAAQAAVACEKETGLPAEITVAQWALESGWGSAAPGNNCFGIKKYPGCQVQAFPTQEVIGGERKSMTLEFAAFDSLTACFEKHARLLTEGEPYAKAWAAYQQDRDLSHLINGIAPHYATDPAYAHKVQQIVAMPQVEVALAQMRGAA